MLPQSLQSLLVVLGVYSLAVIGMPWDPMNAMNARATMGSMVVGATPLEGMGPIRSNQVAHRRHLGLRGGESALGNLTVLKHVLNPPQFIISRKQLYYYMNATTIYPVNVVNTTLPEKPPLQLIVGKKLDGIRGGLWRFSGSMLWFDFPGRQGTQGVVWSCPVEDKVWPSVFIFPPGQDGTIGPDCNSMTFHSWANAQ